MSNLYFIVIFLSSKLSELLFEIDFTFVKYHFLQEDILWETVHDKEGALTK